MKNRDVAHEFFWDINGLFNRGSMTVSYNNNKYWSYYTCIAKIAHKINGDTVCILSDNSFSSTTAKHISELRHASPFDVIYLPQHMGADDFNTYDVIKCCTEGIEHYSKRKLTQKYNRECFLNYYNMLKNTLSLEDFQTQLNNIQNTLNDFKELYENIKDKDKLKEFKAKQTQREAEKQAKLKLELDNILNTHSYINILKMVFMPDYKIDKDLRLKIKKYINPYDDLSFVNFVDDFAFTSQGIRVNRREAETLLKLWNKGKLKHGMTISHYIVLEVMPDYVKIGCHKIPTDNLRALLNELENAEKVA